MGMKKSKSQQKVKRYRTWIPSKRKMIISQDVKFLKDISLRNNNVPDDFFPQ